jgi:N-acetylglucosamine malate deacetylase 1
MKTKMNIVQKKNINLRVFIGSKLRQVYCSMLFNWILHIKSKQIAITEKTAIVFAPHQDDETFGCGGMIAIKRAKKVPVNVVFLTDGKHSIPEWIKPEEIIKIRQEEALTALNILGVSASATHFLGYGDGTLTGLTYEERTQIIIQLSELLKAYKPEEIYLPHRKDRHLDHEATYNLVKDAIALSNLNVEIFQYPVWILWQNPLSSNLKLQEISGSYSISINTVQNQKKQAIASYKSQITTLPPGFLTRFLSTYEIFIKS